MKYGDYDNVTKDSRTLDEIYSRQGSTLLIETLAEHVGKIAIKFNLNVEEREKIKNSVLDELREEINERI